MNMSLQNTDPIWEHVVYYMHYSLPGRKQLSDKDWIKVYLEGDGFGISRSEGVPLDSSGTEVQRARAGCKWEAVERMFGGDARQGLFSARGAHNDHLNMGRRPPMRHHSPVLPLLSRGIPSEPT